MTEKMPPKGMILSDFISNFVIMSVVFCNTNLGEISDMAKSSEHFVHQRFGFFINFLSADVRGYYSAPMPEKIKMKVIGETEEASTIEAIEVTLTTDEIYYDLMGRKATNHEKGIYIKNGKKVIIK